MCTCARPYRRAGRCGFGGRGVTNGIRADPRGCAYGSVCGHRAHGACGPEMGHTTWHMGRHWTYGRALRGKVPGRWGTQHGIWVGTGRVSWTNEDVRFFEGG
jgi:hypothetical protein